MNSYKGTIKTASGQRDVTVRANDVGSAERLMEQQGKLLYRAKMIPG